MISNLKKPSMLSMGKRQPLPLSWMPYKSLSYWKHLFTFMPSLYKWLQFLFHNKNSFFPHRDSFDFLLPNLQLLHLCFSLPFSLYGSKGVGSTLKAKSTPFTLNQEHFPPSQGSYTFSYLFMSLYVQHTFSAWFFPMTVKCLPLAFFFPFKESRTQTSLDFTNPSSYHYFFSD